MLSRLRRCVNFRLWTLAICTATITFSCGSCDVSVDARNGNRVGSSSYVLIAEQTESISIFWR